MTARTGTAAAPSRAGRAWFGLNALVVLLGVIVQLFATAGVETGFFDTTPERVLNVFAFFTIQSNLIVGATTLLLAVGRATTSLAFCTFRLIGLVGITLTFIVFHAVLRQLQDLTGQAAFADFLLHTASPLLCVSGWLVFGPRRLITREIVLLSLLYPLVWGCFTLVRGELVGFYPYPFMDVDQHGYGRVTLNLVLVGGAFVALAAAASWLDGRLAFRRHEASATSA